MIWYLKLSKYLKKMTFLDAEMTQKIDVLIPWPKNILDDDIKWRDSNCCYEVWRQFYDRAENLLGFNVKKMPWRLLWQAAPNSAREMLAPINWRIIARRIAWPRAIRQSSPCLVSLAWLFLKAYHARHPITLKKSC